jgi:NTE family protein
MIHKKKIGLALSGGGYRAAAFHLGTLRKLDQMGILDKVDILSTISGGSITGAAYCLSKENYKDFESSFTEILKSKNVIKKVLWSWYFIRTLLFILLFLGISVFLMFTPYPWISYVVLFAGFFLLIRYQFKIFPASKAVQQAYEKYFFHGATLDKMAKKVKLVIGSTNLQTGRPFVFSKADMGDSTYRYIKDGGEPIYFKPKEFPVAKAVMASSCVPFAFTPLGIEKKYYVYEKDAKRVDPQLVDGGVYDNQGIHKLTIEGSYLCNMVIVSDAGNKMSFFKSYNNTLVLLMRTVDVFMNRIKNSQMMKSVYKPAGQQDMQVAYLSLGWDMDKCIPGFIDNLKEKLISQEVITAHHIPVSLLEDVEANRDEIRKIIENNVGYEEMKKKNLNKEEMCIARSVSTNLKPLTTQQIECLSKHAENMTEMQVKLYCPEFFEEKTK